MAEPYTKTALTLAQQLQHLQSRGLVVTNEELASAQLRAISYYRLSAYWHPFRSTDYDGQFVPGTRFEQVIELYEFDRQLRLLVLDALERVEIAIRSRITYHMGHKYGEFGHADAANFHPNFRHARWLAKLEEETQRSSDEFIRHYKTKYTNFPRIPVWILTEVISFGALSFFYKGLRNHQQAGVEDKKEIASYFGLHHKQLGDWLHTLTYVRNVCAHHSRLWNRKLAIRTVKAKQAEWRPPIAPRNDKVFYILLMLRHLLRQSGNGDDWAEQITQLLNPICSNSVFRQAMGIPDGWQEHPLWQ